MGDEHPNYIRTEAAKLLAENDQPEGLAPQKHSVITTLTPYFVRHELWN